MPNRLCTGAMPTIILLRVMMSRANPSESATRPADWTLLKLQVKIHMQPQRTRGIPTGGMRRRRMHSFWFTILHQEVRSRSYVFFSALLNIHGIPLLCSLVPKSIKSSGEKFRRRKQWNWQRTWAAPTGKSLHERDAVSARYSRVWHSCFCCEQMQRLGRAS